MFPELKELKEIGERIATALEKTADAQEKSLKFVKAICNMTGKYLDTMPEEIKESEEGKAMTAMYGEFQKACEEL
jgi:hypothetical protein